MNHVIAPAPPVAVPVAGSDALFPVRRVYCVGRNYAAHAREMGADEVIDFSQEDPVAAIKRLTGGRGVDVAIEALGKQETFQWCLESTRPGGIVSSLGVYGGKLEIPVEPFVYGIGEKRILTTLCPGGKERMRTLMELVRHGRLDLSKLITHRFPLQRAPEAYHLADLGLGPREIAAAVRAGALLRVTDGVVLLPDAAQQAVRILAGLPQPFTLSEARRALGTTRRVAVPLLELLDRRGDTRRLPDDRRTTRT